VRTRRAAQRPITRAQRWPLRREARVQANLSRRTRRRAHGRSRRLVRAQPARARARARTCSCSSHGARSASQARKIRRGLAREGASRGTCTARGAGSVSRARGTSRPCPRICTQGGRRRAQCRWPREVRRLRAISGACRAGSLRPRAARVVRESQPSPVCTAGAASRLLLLENSSG
jgi:hypothetical protein